MFHVANATPFEVGAYVLPDAHGADTLIVVAKATFAITLGTVRVAPEQREIVLSDEYRGEPDASSLAYASEVHLTKPATDVVLVGSAYAPRGKAVPQFGFLLSVGPVKRVLQVLGDRSYGAFGDPTPAAPVSEVPLIYERAFGGRHVLGEGSIQTEERNPVGAGFRGERSVRDLVGTPLPNLLEPREVDHPATPVGVGYVAPSWQPRRGFAGSYGAKWLAERAPFLPEDFDPRFLQAASSGLVVEGRLKGGEPVQIVNGTPPPHQTQHFELPHCALSAEVWIGEKKEQPQFVLDTLLLEPSAGHFCMVWQASANCHNLVARIERITVRLESLQGVQN